MRLSVKLGVTALAAATLGGTAAGEAMAKAQDPQVVICKIDMEPVHVYTDPIPLNPPTNETVQRIREIWKTVALEKYGKTGDQMKRWDDMRCATTTKYDWYVKSNLASYSYKTFKRVPFPVERILDGSTIAKSEPSQPSSRAKPRADIIIEDAKPTFQSPAEIQKVILQGQREDAERRAKTMAAAAKENAKAKELLAKLLEKERKRGRSQ